MNPKIEETIVLDFVTASPTTGAAVDADSTPTCEVFEDVNDTAILTPAVVKRTGKTGNYRIAIPCTAASGFEAGKSYNVVVSATVATVAAKAVAKSFQLRTYSVDDLMTAAMDKTGFSLTAAYDPAKTAAQAGVPMTLTSDYNPAKTASQPGDAMTLTSVYDPAKTAATQASVSTLTAYVDTEVAAILAAVDTEVAAIKAKTDNLPVDPADASDINASFATVNSNISAVVAYVDTEVNAIKAKTDQLNFTAGDLKATLDGETVTVAINNDKNGYTLTSAYDAAKTAAQAGSPVTVSVNNDKTGYTLTAVQVTAIADALLKRDWLQVSGEAASSLIQALRSIRNKWSIGENGVLSVYKEDGVTLAWQRNILSTANAVPVVGME